MSRLSGVGFLIWEADGAPRIYCLALCCKPPVAPLPLMKRSQTKVSELHVACGLAEATGLWPLRGSEGGGNERPKTTTAAAAAEVSLLFVYLLRKEQESSYWNNLRNVISSCHKLHFLTFALSIFISINLSIYLFIYLLSVVVLQGFKKMI